MSPRELSDKLKERSREAVQFLFREGGKFAGNKRFMIGNLQGEPGESLVVFLESGFYKDFSSGDNTPRDLLQLFQDKFGSKKAGYDAAYEFLGIQKPIRSMDSNTNNNLGRKRKKQWTVPDEDWVQLTESDTPTVWEYLTETRKIKPSILQPNEIGAFDDEAYVFLTYSHDTPPVNCGALYINLRRRKGKKVIRQHSPMLFTLFGHTSAIDKVKWQKHNKKGSLIITAGQIDCLSLRSQGIMNCVSIPSGESDLSWIENSWDWMHDRYDDFILLFDNDETGEDFTEKVATKIGYAHCRKGYLPKEYKDVNEAHVAGYDLHNCYKEATDFKMDMLVKASSLKSKVLEVMKRGRREDEGIPFMGWEEGEYVKFRIRPKEMTIITGFAGHGKSNGLYQWVACLIFKYKQKVFLASLEEDPEEIEALIAYHALGFLYDEEDESKKKAFNAALDIIGDQLYIFSYRGTADYKQLFQTCEFSIRKYGIEHAVIDSVSKTNLRIEDNEHARIFVSAASDLVTLTGTHLYLVAHPAKGDDRDFSGIPGYQQVKGDNSFGNACFNCITFWKNTFKEVAEEGLRAGGGVGWKQKGSFGKDGERRPDKVWTPKEVRDITAGILYISKQKVGGRVGRYDLFYDHANYRFHRRSDFSDLPTYAEDIIDRYIDNSEDYDDDDEDGF